MEQTSSTSSLIGLAHLLPPFRHPQPPTHPHCPKWLNPPPSTLLCSIYPSAPSSSSSTEDICINPRPTVTTGQVNRHLERLHQRKAAGPDGITPRILKTCASQLCPVLGNLYNLSTGEDPDAVEKVLLGSSPHKVEAIQPSRLQISCCHMSCDEGPGETGLSSAKATG